MSQMNTTVVESLRFLLRSLICCGNLKLILSPNQILNSESRNHFQTRTENDINMQIYLFDSGKVLLLLEKILFLIINYV